MEFLWVRSLVKRGRCLWFHGSLRCCSIWGPGGAKVLHYAGTISVPSSQHLFIGLLEMAAGISNDFYDARDELKVLHKCPSPSKPFLSIRQLLKAFFLHPLPTKSFTLKLDYKGLLGKAQNAAQGTSRSHEEWSVINEFKSCDVNGLTKQLPSCVWNYGKCLQILLNTFGPHCNFAGKVLGMCSIMSL